MAAHTGGGLVRTFQWELCRGVIKRTNFPPLLGVVAGLAGLCGPMRIVMTHGAALLREAILAARRGRRGGGGRRWLMTVRAKHGDMRSGKDKLRLAMAREAISGRHEGNLRVT